MDGNSLLYKLSLKTNINYDLLKFIHNRAFIAGGSIINIIKDIEFNNKSDIDIFIYNNKNNKNEFYNILHKIKMTYNNIELLYYDNSMNDSISILNINILNKKVQLQLILSSFNKPMTILKNFDMDYIQCGIHKNKLYITRDCKNAINNNIINKVSSRVRYDRLLKAAKKGFKVNLITDCIKDVDVEIKKKDYYEIYKKNIIPMTIIYGINVITDTINMNYTNIIDINIKKYKNYNSKYFIINQRINFIYHDSKDNKNHNLKYLCLNVNIKYTYYDHSRNLYVLYIDESDPLYNINKFLKYKNSLPKNFKIGNNKLLISFYLCRIKFIDTDIYPQIIIEKFLNDSIHDNILSISLNNDAINNINDTLYYGISLNQSNNTSNNSILIAENKISSYGSYKDTLTHIKVSALQCFIYNYKNENMKIKDALNEAYKQYEYDLYKYKHNESMLLFCSLYKTNRIINTINDLISYMR
jgi:hypothetical protein